MISVTVAGTVVRTWVPMPITRCYAVAVKIIFLALESLVFLLNRLKGVG
jgi:hypothetical protein